jgi:hypothetical protein
MKLKTTMMHNNFCFIYLIDLKFFEMFLIINNGSNFSRFVLKSA